MDKPNFLIIMADQLTPFMVGAYGNKQVITPNLDKLCSAGIRFDAAYSPNPLCTPARASFMTGKYTYDLGCFDNGHAFSSEEPTWAHYLSLAGYDTVLTGKMHFIGPDQMHGLDKRLTTDSYPADYSWLPKFLNKETRLMQDPWGNAINYTKELCHPAEWSSYINYDEETQFRAKEYLYGMVPKRPQEKPFCLCVSYHHPHDPFWPPKKYYDKYADVKMEIPRPLEYGDDEKTFMDKSLAENFHRLDKYDITKPEGLLELRRCYAALTTYIDDKIGELLEILKNTGLEKNTVVIFTSDHGDMLGERGMVQKRCFYEWSSRIPLIMCFPDKNHSGTIIKEPCSLLDIGETMIDLAGARRPDAPANDAVSLMQYLGAPAIAREIYSEYHGEGVMWPCFMIRKDNFKYTYIYKHETQLFNVIADPGERKNLSGLQEYAETENQLKNLLLARFSPGQVQEYLEQSRKRRAIVREANKARGISWDYSPVFPDKFRYTHGR
ncbi:MAG: choline-sulfatase [Treponema sp.]|nr:choline-sulfatase [Treponema sp.]